MKFITIDGGTASLEITLQCNLGCAYCYRREGVSRHAQHVSFKSIIDRIDWIHQHTTATEICLLGGEPLLHPDFPDIVDYILAQGLGVRVITTADTEHHDFSCELPINLQYLIEMYAQGKVYIELSLQPGKNNNSFLKMVASLKAVMGSRRAALKAAGKYDPEHNDLFSTIVVAKGLAKDKEAFFALIKWVNDIHYPNYNPFISNPGFWETAFNELPAVFTSDWDASEFHYFTVSASTDKAFFQHKFRYFPESYCSVRSVRHESGDIFRVTVSTHAKNSPCRIMGTKIDKSNQTVWLEGLLVKADGEVLIPNPRCIPAKSGLCNVDIHLTQSDIVAAMILAMSEIRFLNIMTKAHHAKSPQDLCQVDRNYPTIEGEKPACSGCRTDTACTACHSIRRDWTKISLS